MIVLICVFPPLQNKSSDVLNEDEQLLLNKEGGKTVQMHFRLNLPELCKPSQRPCDCEGLQMSELVCHLPSLQKSQNNKQNMPKHPKNSSFSLKALSIFIHFLIIVFHVTVTSPF